MRTYPTLPSGRLAEETGQDLSQIHLEQLATYGRPGRDPRMRVISVAYLAFAPELPEPLAGEGTTAAAWIAVDSLGLRRRHRPATAGYHQEAGLRPRRDPHRRRWSERDRSLSTRRWPPGSSSSRSRSPNCERSTRRSGARACTPETSTAKCSRFPASWRAPARPRRPAGRAAGRARGSTGAATLGCCIRRYCGRAEKSRCADSVR